jgi:hypothetical protein
MSLMNQMVVDRKAFEENYKAIGGSLNLLKWDECSDGTGIYQPDYENIDSDDPVYLEDIKDMAENASSSFALWSQCLKFNAIPDGYVLMPTEPTQELIDQEMEGKVLPAVMGAYERAVDNFKKRYSKMINTLHPLN